MVRLDSERRQEIHGGIAISSAAIMAVHGVITITWAVLDLMNIISDQLPKKTTPHPGYGHQWSFNNSLVNSRITICS